MKTHTPELFVYGRTYEEAMDIVCRRRLLHCEPVPEPLCGFCFSDDRDLTYVATAMAGDVEFYENVMIAGPARRSLIEEFIERIEAGPRVEHVELLGVWFWDDQDQAIFEEELGFAA